MNALSAAGLADLAGVTEAEVQRLVDLGVLVTRDGAGPFRETDVQRVRLATACEQAGLPMAGIAAAIRAGRLSFAFLEAAPYRRWAVRSARTYRQVSQEAGVPLELLGSALEAIGFARMTPDEPIREDELEIVPLLQLGLATGILDQLWLTRLGRGYAEGMRLIANAEKDVWQARFIAPELASGADQQTARELASQLSGDLNFASLVDRSSREHGGVPVKWLGDGVMVHFREPAGAVLAALGMVEGFPAAGLPPVHVGVAAGPVVVQGGDYFGRTVNLAARIAAYASVSRVLVSEPVVQRAPPQGVTFVELGLVQLEGIAHPVRLLEARRA
jgi:hypothetical protein